MLTLWLGRGLSALATLFLVVDGAMKVAKPGFIVDANTPLRVPEGVLVGIGITLLVCTALYAWPATSGLGAVLLTGYLGGAVAIHVRVGSGWFEVIFPVLVAACAWGGLALRQPRVRALFAL